MIYTTSCYTIISRILINPSQLQTNKTLIKPYFFCLVFFLFYEQKLFSFLNRYYRPLIYLILQENVWIFRQISILEFVFFD